MYLLPAMEAAEAKAKVEPEVDADCAVRFECSGEEKREGEGEAAGDQG